MANYRKNLMVGLTVLTSLVLLGYMLLKFGAEPAKWFTPKKMMIQLKGSSADGISEGSVVTYLGVPIGQVSKIERTVDKTQVVMTAAVDEKDPPPANVIGLIHVQFVGNGGSVALQVPPGMEPQGSLKAGDIVPTDFVGNGLLPKELVTHLDQMVLSTTRQVEHIGKLIDSLDSTVSDQQIRSDLKTSMANVRAITENAKAITTKLSDGTAQVTADAHEVSMEAKLALHKTQGHIDDLSKQMDDRMVQTSTILEHFDAIVAKIDSGKGTAGLLINDGKLYESLVSTSKELNLTISDLKRLVEQWEQEGVYLKLNK